jgi:hypothetical protein
MAAMTRLMCAIGAVLMVLVAFPALTGASAAAGDSGEPHLQGQLTINEDSRVDPAHPACVDELGRHCCGAACHCCLSPVPDQAAAYKETAGKGLPSETSSRGNLPLRIDRPPIAS